MIEASTKKKQKSPHEVKHRPKTNAMIEAIDWSMAPERGKLPGGFPELTRRVGMFLLAQAGITVQQWTGKTKAQLDEWLDRYLVSEFCRRTYRAGARNQRVVVTGMNGELYHLRLREKALQAEGPDGGTTMREELGDIASGLNSHLVGAHVAQAKILAAIEAIPEIYSASVQLSMFAPPLPEDGEAV